MPYDPETEEPIGALEATVTFTNKHATSAKEFEAATESKLAGIAVAASINGTIKLLPNHDDTGVILGNG